MSDPDRDAGQEGARAETIRTPLDKRHGAFLPEKRRRYMGYDPRAPAFFAMREAWDFPEPPGSKPPEVWGQYPKGFIQQAARALGAQRDRILHLCSGALRRGDGIRVDIRFSVRPDICADARRLPLRPDSVDAVLIDPPYSVEYTAGLYGRALTRAGRPRKVRYPRPSHLLREAARVVRPCGRVGILHFIVPMVPKEIGLRQIACFGITTGAGYRIRALSIYEKSQGALFEEPECLRLVPVTLAEGRAFIARHHRHSRAPLRWICGVGLDLDGKLVGVACLEGPRAPQLCDGETVEISRVCTLGTRNGASKLYGAMVRAAAALGYRRVVTYTLSSEPGSSLRASGFEPVSEVKAESWDRRRVHAAGHQGDFFDARRYGPPEERVRWERRC